MGPEMDKIQADENRAAYHEFLAALNQIFLEALRLAEGNHAQEIAPEGAVGGQPDGLLPTVRYASTSAPASPPT